MFKITENVIHDSFFCTYKHTVFCREIEIVVIYALFSDNKCPLFTRLGGGSPKADIVRFFYRFSHRKASLSGFVNSILSFFVEH